MGLFESGGSTLCLSLSGWNLYGPELPQIVAVVDDPVKYWLKSSGRHAERHLISSERRVLRANDDVSGSLVLVSLC